MIRIHRYAIYYAPRPGMFADRADAWLGRSADRGAALPATDPVPAQPAFAGIDLPSITRDARRYGFHGTLRAPFRPAPGLTGQAIAASLSTLASVIAPVVCSGLRLENLQGFLALTPEGCEAALLELGARVVEATDPLRASLTAEDIARRRPEALSPRQRALLDRWGYPFVMDEFRFHLTLTDRLSDPAAVMAAVQAHFAPVLPRPFVIEDLCLFGEDGQGMFHLLHRYALTG